MLTAQYPFRRGDVIRVSGRASVTTKTELFGRVQYEDGTKDRFEVLITHPGDRSNVLFRTPDQFLQNGFVEALTVDTGIIKRGEYYMMVAVERLQHHYPIAAGYIGVPHMPLGEFEHPISGKGLLDWEQIANDVAGDVETTFNLGVANARRNYKAFLLKYESSNDAASRNITIIVRDMADVTGPTGFSIDEDAWESAILPLIADQQGLIYMKKNLIAFNDNGSLAYSNNTTAPHPFPLLVESGETGDLVISPVDGHANDRYDAFLQVEEWISP